MRARVAKQLRRVAQAGTVGAPDREYTTKGMGRVIKGFPRFFSAPDPVVLTSRCTRAVYRQLKKLRKLL